MKQVIETAEIKRKIEQLVNSAYRDYKRGDWDAQSKKLNAAVTLFDILVDLVCEKETWEDDMFRLNEWFDSVKR